VSLLQIGQQAALYSYVRQVVDLGNNILSMSEGSVKESNCTDVKSTHSDQAIQLHHFAATMQPFT